MGDGGEAAGFWAGKVACWDLRGCAAEARQTCPAYQDRSRPCWVYEDTLCAQLLGVRTCFRCEVFRRYGGKDAALPRDRAPR